MGGFFNALWFWLPVLLYKAVSAFFRTIWKFNLWILQTISGVPLYYCRPEYRMPGIFLGTFGVIIIFNFVFFFVVLVSEGTNYLSQQGISIGGALLMAAFGAGFIVLCRILVRRGSI